MRLAVKPSTWSFGLVILITSKTNVADLTDTPDCNTKTVVTTLLCSTDQETERNGGGSVAYAIDFRPRAMGIYDSEGDEIGLRAYSGNQDLMLV
jgi:hypothetical protein